MVVNQYLRYQRGLTIGQLFPSQNGLCACGCQRELPKSRKKWHSDTCRNEAYITFAIVKGDTSVIRAQLYLRDHGACRNCGVISDEWHADHIIPVSQGGSACDLSNFQTLCIDCHKDKTHNFPHHNAISSQAVSIFLTRILTAVGQYSERRLKTSNEIQHLGVAISPSVSSAINCPAN